MKLNYFNQDKPDQDDFMLEAAKGQGYVPSGCLLGGQVVMMLVARSDDPCDGCNCPREKCGGRPRRTSK